MTQGQGGHGETWGDLGAGVGYRGTQGDPGAGGSSPQRGFAEVWPGHGLTGMELAGAGAELGLAR